MSAAETGTIMDPVEANRKRAWDEFSAGKLVVKSRPFKASIEITRNCNFKCVMCAQSWDPLYARYNPGFNMKPELFGRITEEIFAHLEYAHLQGYGETVLSPHWPEILEMCRPFVGKVRFGLVTNLSRRDPAMWRKMVEMGFVIIFSCDGATAETFEKIRVGGRFAHILENLEVISKARRERGRGRLYFYTVLQRLNYHEMAAMVELAARFGADRITFTGVNGRPGLPAAAANWRQALYDRLKDWSSSAAAAVGLQARLLPLRGMRLPGEELARLRDRALQRGRSLGLPVILNDAALAGAVPRRPRLVDLGHREGIPESVRVAAHQTCFKPYSYLNINYKGDVSPCNYLQTNEVWQQMGSLARSSFEEIWNSPAYREMRRKLLSGRPDNAGCRWCFAHRLAE